MMFDFYTVDTDNLFCIQRQRRISFKTEITIEMDPPKVALEVLSYHNAASIEEVCSRDFIISFFSSSEMLCFFYVLIFTLHFVTGGRNSDDKRHRRANRGNCLVSWL